MSAMVYRTVLLAALAIVTALGMGPGPQEKPANTPHYPAFEYDVARKHELKPHRRTIPTQGMDQGFNQLHLKLIVSPAGFVTEASASGDDKVMKHWPAIQGEVERWQFQPFEQAGKPITAEVEEYIDLVPPERLPKVHVAPPALTETSKVAITLERSGCYGTCPAYAVTVATDGITFDGKYYVVAAGKHSDTADPEAVRKLAKQFIAADFYSMDRSYRASVTDNPTYVLSIDIDGHQQSVEDYVGSWVGMPAIISELEQQVDDFARTQRWINAADGLVDSLRTERFNFQAYPAQLMLKEASQRGAAETVRELLEVGVPLQPLPAPKPAHNYDRIPFENVGWLTAASSNPEVLKTLMLAGASKADQLDKDHALIVAARTGDLASVQQLIAYKANPLAHVKEQGTVLIAAAESGNPEVLREILRFHPNLEDRGRNGKTAIFGAAEYGRKDDQRVACVRILAEAGANVNARDKDGNTPPHKTLLTDIEEELLKLGADINARNNNGDTPIATTVDREAYELYLAHGADLTLRNNAGNTMAEVVKAKGPLDTKALEEAIDLHKHPPIHP
jgi:hypothetical protein